MFSWIQVSRNASLGKIAYISNDSKVILNGGISFFNFKDKYEFYIPAFFITNYGSDYLTCITSGGGTQQNAKRGTLLSVPIPKPTLKTNEKLMSTIANDCSKCQFYFHDETSSIKNS